MIGAVSCGTKRLILSADDFGMHTSINAAVETAHVNGLLTSASIVACGECFDDAVAIARRNPRLGVGIHLTLVGERPVSPAGSISSIISGDGKLPENHLGLCIDILKKKVDLRHIRIECEAQCNKFFRTGLVPTHVDSHRHLHIFTPIFKAIEPVLKEFGITKIRSLRIPASEYRYGGMTKIIFAIFAQWAGSFYEADYMHPDHFLGFFNSGSIDFQYLKGVLPKLKPGVTEMLFHPGTDNSLIMQKYGFWKGLYGWGCDWEREHRVLLDAEIAKMIDANDISVINYSAI